MSVFRANVNRGYALLPEPYQVDVLSVAAYDHGVEKDLTYPDPVTGDMTFRPEYVAKTFRKFISIFQFLASTPGYDSVVLGALGCGAFKNPPADVAQIFNELLQQYAGMSSFLPPLPRSYPRE